MLIPKRSGSSSAMSMYSPACMRATNFFGTGGRPVPIESTEVASGSGSFTESGVLSFIVEMWLSKPGVIGIPAQGRG